MKEAFGTVFCGCRVSFGITRWGFVTVQALSSIPANPHSRFAWSYIALAMLVDCGALGGGWGEGGGGGREDSHEACNLSDN